MITMLQFLTFLRILIVMLSGETSVRYALWWWETRRTAPEALLVSLMLGISVVHGAIAVVIGTAVLSQAPFNSSFLTVNSFTFFSAVVIGGTFYHLIPCWRISCNLSMRWVVLNLVIRAVGSALLAFTFSAIWQV